ncbi:MAG: ECF-type sigma factor [Parasphingorhabdus sp.]|uniref:ECF-type sigma factor n=1 Tax=Parasphingorhabdus sp. TaxID=2709688 RepID=UPI00329A4CBD
MSGALDHKALMNEWQSGDHRAGNKLFSDLQQELELIAAAKLAGENNSSLSTGDLINEAVIRLSKLKEIDLQSKAHILALASRIMRQVLVDQARKRNSGKRDHAKVTLVTNIGVWDRPIELLTLDWLLDELKTMDQERAEIVEMRFFGGMSIADIALVLEMSEATVKRRWVSTRAWLHDRLKD